MNKYEKAQVAAIEAWKLTELSVVHRTFERITAPFTWAATKVIPAKLVQTAIEGANSAAQGLVDADAILRDGAVDSIEALRAKGLPLADELAGSVHSWALAVGGASGAALGATGVGGIALDVSALLTLSLRTIHKVGLCYGYHPVNEQFVLGVLAAASATTKAEKLSAVDALKAVEVEIIEDVWEEAIVDAAKNRIARGGVFFTARTVGRHFGRNMAQAKAMQFVPMVGAIFGVATNVAFLSDVGWAARRLFQERWLRDNRKPATPKKKPAARKARPKKAASAARRSPKRGPAGTK